MDQMHLPEETISEAPRRLSQVLREIAGSGVGSITVQVIRDALGDRAFAALLIVFGAINLLPLPPGSSAVLGLPLVLVSGQMIFARTSAWLPQFILRKEISRAQFDYAMRKLIPALEWLERFIRPRYWPIPRGQTDRVLGLLIFILAVAVTVPIPLGNWLPALGCTLLALALSERDGILLGIGVAVGAISLIIIIAVAGAAGAAASWLLHLAD